MKNILLIIILIYYQRKKINTFAISFVYLLSEISWGNLCVILAF